MKNLINESEKSLIRKMHENEKIHNFLLKQNNGLVNTISDSIVITDWVSPDNKYLILFDELYDLHTSKKLGDIWENFDNFKLFISHSFEVATNVPQQIKESVANTIKSLVLTESTGNMSKLKPILKQFLKENDFTNWVGKGLVNTKDWAVDQVKQFGSDVSDLVTTSFKGLKSAGIAITQGDWKEILNLLGKGMLFFARKLRALLYNPVGMVLDAIVVATGIGKLVQWVPWAIIVALDIYEMSTGDYEDKDLPMWLRWIIFGADVLGLVFAGGVAGSARAALSVFKGAKTAKEFAAIAAKNPNTVKLIQKIASSLSKVPNLLRQASTYLKSTKLAKASPWINNILSASTTVLGKWTKSLQATSKIAEKATKSGQKIIAKTAKTNAPKTVGQTLKVGAKAGARNAITTTVIDRAANKGMQLYSGLSDAEMESMKRFSKVEYDYKKETGVSISQAINNAFES
jgi:hypothetical protein